MIIHLRYGLLLCNLKSFYSNIEKEQENSYCHTYNEDIQNFVFTKMIGKHMIDVVKLFFNF